MIPWRVIENSPEYQQANPVKQRLAREMWFDSYGQDVVGPDDFERAKMEQQQVKQLQGLFKHCKFFLSREVPRECFTFLIRYCCRNP